MNKTFILLLLLLLVFSLLITGCGGCKVKNGQCCQGDKCVQSSIACLKGTHHEFKGCNDMCIPQSVCTPD